MQEPAKGRDLGWRSVWKMFLPWTVSVYALSALTIDLVLPSQGLLGERGFHLTFLIPAVCVGSIGTVVLTDRAPQTRLGGALLGAVTGMISSLLGGYVADTVLTQPHSEGRSWFGLLMFPVVLFSTLIGVFMGVYAHRLGIGSTSSDRASSQS
jgi:energy-converting hydrogenase Eha subunit A